MKNKLPYKQFNELKKPLTLIRNPADKIQAYLDAYYLTPLMVRSIFEDLIKYLISEKEFETALEFIQKIKILKPEYDFIKIFSSYEKNIYEMRSNSVN